MNKTGLSILFYCSMMLCSCAIVRNLHEVSSTRHLQKVSSLHFSSLSMKDTGVRIDGYYLSKNHSPFGNGTEVLVFYDNGTAALYYIDAEKQSDSVTDFSQTVMRPSKNSDGARYVGPYKVSLDTLYVNLYRKGLLSGLEIYRHYFRIVNSDSLFCFRTDAPQQVFDGRILFRDNNMGYHFVKAINLQKPRDHFLRKREWMWEDKTEWVDYMNTYHQTKH